MKSREGTVHSKMDSWSDSVELLWGSVGTGTKRGPTLYL